MDHDRARAAFERLADSLDSAADHLIGPGFEFTRRALTNAAGAATELAGLHRAEEQTDPAPRTVHGISRDYFAWAAEQDAVADRTRRRLLSREYVEDLLGPLPPRPLVYTRACRIHDERFPCEGGCPGRAGPTPDPFKPTGYTITTHDSDCARAGLDRPPVPAGEQCPDCGGDSRRVNTPPQENPT
jgi:hypothetical protein